MQIYYKSKLAIVRDSKEEDTYELSKNMRISDIIELWRFNHKTPKEALSGGYEHSAICFTVEKDGTAIAMFGIVPHTILGNNATIWFLASPELEKIQRAFLKYSRQFIDIMLNHYPLLMNYVDVENKQAVKWLKWCGAKFGATGQYGVEPSPFQYFEFRRN